MITEKGRKSARYLRIIFTLKNMRNNGLISQDEYSKAKQFYKKLTGADIVIDD